MTLERVRLVAKYKVIKNLKEVSLVQFWCKSKYRTIMACTRRAILCTVGRCISTSLLILLKTLARIYEC